MSETVIGFCGMTHLGINSAIASAARGFEVVGFDLDEELIENLSRHEFPIEEPDLIEFVDKYQERLTFSASLNDLEQCDVIYIAPDVPTDENGISDISNVENLFKLVTNYVKEDSVLVILSQVSPGFTRNFSKLHKHLYYQVETLIFGRAIDRATNPERFIIGCSDPSNPLPNSLVKYLNAFDCPILPMRYESAELAKISINMCLVASVSTANTLAEICEQIGADWKEIIPSLRLDKRIGQFSYIEAGLGISGGNLERDLTSVIKISESAGTDCGIVKAWLNNSKYRKSWPLRILEKEVFNKIKNAKIAILGLTYKENTHSIKNSPAILLIESLSDFKLVAYDPVARVKINNLEVKDSAYEAVDSADVVLIMTPWQEFRELSIKKIKDLMNGNIIIDPYRILDTVLLKENHIEHFVLGASN